MWAIACIMGELIDGQPLFPGENEIDQLYLIQKILGPLTAEQKENFLKNPRFLGTKFPEITKPETIERRYIGKLSKKALSFMKSLLKMDPKERLTCSEAMKHPYFEDYLNNNTENNPKTTIPREIDSKTKDNINVDHQNQNLDKNLILRTKTREKRADLELLYITSYIILKF